MSSFVRVDHPDVVIHWFASYPESQRRRGRRERERHERLNGRPPKGGYMAANVSVSEMGPLPDAGVPDALKYGQQCPRGVVRPPLVTVRQETPPPATYIPQDR